MFISKVTWVALNHDPHIKHIDTVRDVEVSAFSECFLFSLISEQIKLLTGHTADPVFISKVTWVALNHDPHIKHIDTVRAFHFGNCFLVHVDIVLPKDMSVSTLLCPYSDLPRKAAHHLVCMICGMYCEPL